MFGDIIEMRKIQHIVFSVKEDVKTRNKTTLFEDISFVHQSIPEAPLDDISLETNFFGKSVQAPILISGMTGGAKLAEKINREIARAAQKLGIPMGVGSQRAALANPSLKRTFSVVREEAPDIPVIANIGMAQVSEGLSKETIYELVDMVDADALAVHFNPLQEALQPEGDTDYEGLMENLSELVRESPVPVIAKQTGEGFSKESARRLLKTGISGIDVGGAGGTSFAVIEALRARFLGLDELEEIAWTFSGWGIPTAASILEVRSVSKDVFLVGSGGIRSGVDVAKALRLGADFAGVALPVMRAVYEKGSEGVERLLRKMMGELKIVIHLVGARNVAELRNAPIVITGRLREWMNQRELSLR